MMNVGRKFFQNFIKYFLYIAVFAQIVSGTVYLVCNFTTFTLYPETEEMVHAARSLVIDEYIGFLYPLFIRMCLGIQDLFGIGYYLVAHMVQLVLFFVGTIYLVYPFFRGKKMWMAGFFVVTFPMCMQSILMVAPFAIKGALGFFILGAMVRIWQKKQGLDRKAMLVLCVTYVLAAFNQPDDLYLWIVPMVILGLHILFRKKENTSWKQKAILWMAIVCVFTGALFVGTKVADMGVRGRMHKSVYSVMFQRTIWPNLAMKYGFLPVEMQEYLTTSEAVTSNRYAESILFSVGPNLERNVGFERADELYKEAVKNQFSYNKRAIAKAIGSDFVGYLLEPYSSVVHMNGQNGSAFGKLYSLMCGQGNVGVYGYFCVSFVTLFSLSFVSILKVVKEGLFTKRVVKKGCLLLVGLISYHALWYAVVNVQGIDYRYTLLGMGLFMLLAFSGSVPYQKETKEVARKCTLPKKVWLSCGGVLVGMLFVGILCSLAGKGYQESNMLDGKKIVCFGDSIWGMVKDETGIASLVEKMTGATIENYAISGTTASDVKEKNLQDMVGSVSLEDADYLVIAYGLNDYFQGVPYRNSEAYDVQTYEGALRSAVKKIKEEYPELKILLIGQTYCQFYSYGIVEADSDTRSFGGGVGTDYVAAAKRVAEEYDLLFVSQYEELPMNEWNGKLYLEDATHLNKNGRIQYAKVVAEILLDDYKERNAQ